ncbi:MAG: hypothetical protein EAY66_02695 [Sphingobacteriales bacterium]|nr:MAG: hypothetical protein EAY66_02695 [Sphingobacteriales bacterium]
MVGRNWSEGEAYRQGYNGKENDKDFGEGVQDYGARLYDGLTCRWFAVDPLEAKYPSYSPYNYVLNSPNAFVDPDGRFVIPAWKDEWAKSVKEGGLGLKKEAYQQFVQIANNVYENLLANNPRGMEAFKNSTGLSDNQIKEMFTEGSGPTLSFVDGKSQTSKNGKSISMNVHAIKQLSNDKLPEHKRAENILGLAFTIIHEGIHSGDIQKNKHITGQPEDNDCYDCGQDGEQSWKQSFSGHRGTDWEIYTFGVYVTSGLSIYDTEEDKLKLYYGLYRVNNIVGNIDKLIKNLPKGIQNNQDMIGSLPKNLSLGKGDMTIEQQRKHFKGISSFLMNNSSIKREPTKSNQPKK